MTRYMLDTNIVSHLIKGHPEVARHLRAVPMASVCISSITEGELLFGLAKRPQATGLHNAVKEFLLCVEVLPWNSVTAQAYGTARAAMERQGRVLAPLDQLIAAHAMAAEAILVTNDQAFHQVDGLCIEDWTV
jgi:tRNA(fMet)-specific endonuclease VapC